VAPAVQFSLMTPRYWTVGTGLSLEHTLEEVPRGQSTVSRPWRFDYG